MNDSVLNSQIRKLADGELDQKRRIALLAKADEEPQLYRDIALAFVETQVLNEQLRKMTPWLTEDGESSGTRSTSRKVTASRGGSRVDHDGESDSAVRNSRDRLKNATKVTHLNGSHRSVASIRSKPVVTKSTSQSRRSLIVRFAAAVALAILAGSLGYVLGDSNRDISNDPGVAQNDSPQPLQNDRLGSTGGQATSDNSNTTNDSEQTQQNLVSNVSSNATSPFPSSVPPPASIQFAIDERLRMELLRNGFVINENTQLLKVEVDEGRTVDLPVRKIEVNYLGNRVYQ